MIKLPRKRLREIILLAFFCLPIIICQGCSSKDPIYKPGTYINQAEGYYSTLTVEVTLSAYAIEEINILDHQDPKVLSDIVFEKLPPRIIKAGSTDIDAISGATYTSEALLEAVKLSLIEGKETME